MWYNRCWESAPARRVRHKREKETVLKVLAAPVEEGSQIESGKPEHLREEERDLWERYIAFDVETPNCRNDRISAIGVTVVENGQMTEQYDTLVDPECPFNPFNISLTGITPELVADKPTFPELWQELAPVMDSGLLVAHNAPFDMGVLAKCLRDYGIFWHGTVSYLCTCQMSRRLLPQLPNHRLNTLCDYLGLELDHHRAGSDSMACGEILLHHLRTGARIEPFLRTYDLVGIRTARGR